MPAETTGATETQAATDAQPQAGDPQAQAADAQQPSTGSADDEGGSGTDDAALRRELAQARREAANYRTQLKKREDADKSDVEKATERVTELERELAAERTKGQTKALQLATYGIARKLGFRNPDLAHRLLSASEVEFDEDGAPKNIERLLSDVAKADPYLVNGTTDYGGGPRGTPAENGQDMNRYIRQRAGRSG